MHPGARFLLRALTARDLLRRGDGEAAAPAGLVTSADVAWAIQSQCHMTILETFLASGARKDWQALRALGGGFWLPQGDALRAALDTASKVQFASRKDPQDCALLFVALGKKGQLQGLYKAVRNEKLYTFLANDFSEPRWRSAALKNAFALLSKQQHELAAAFFLLGDDLASAVKVCARQLADLQLALVLRKLNQANAPELLASILREELLPYAEQRQDSWLCCVAHLQLDEPQRALEALACRQADATASKDGAEDGADRCGLRQASQIDPEVVTFHQQVVGHPRNKARLPGALMPGSLVFACSYAYAHRGCHTIAMETLCLPYRAGAGEGEGEGEGEDGRTFDSMAAAQWRLVLAVRHAAALAEHLLCASSKEVRWAVIVAGQ